jgi:hypothetical protein
LPREVITSEDIFIRAQNTEITRSRSVRKPMTHKKSILDILISWQWRRRVRSVTSGDRSNLS